MEVGFQAGAERSALLALAQYAPYPLLVAPFVVLAALSPLAGWRWCLSALAGLVFVATVLMDYQLPQAEEGRNRVRVLTFNVKDYTTLRRSYGLIDIAEEIARHDPDVFVLQDARTFEHRTSDPEVADTVFDGRQVYLFGQYVVASRFPMRDCRNGWISFRDEPHTYVTCVVSAHGTDVDVVTAHFMTPRVGLVAARYNPARGLDEWRQNVADRMTQATTLAAVVSGRRRPMVVAGDLNAPGSSAVVGALREAGLRDAFEVAGRGYGFTWGHSLRWGIPFLRIDYILASREFSVGRALVGEPAGSAHRPVVADLYLDSAPGEVKP
jgi:endonuclease/exonuclease/phosphatase (EEP) superfamily protein YafD